MSPVHIDELNPETRARVLEQLSGTEGGTTALATVEQETLPTFGDPVTLTDDQLADIVIEAVHKMRQYLPYIVAMKERFDSGARDHTNRLKTPIKGCRTWTEFCTKRLGRARQTIHEALAPEPSSAPTPTSVPCICPDCGQPFPSKGQLKKHGQAEHNVPSTDIADFLRRAADAAYNQSKSEYDSLLESISKRILARDGTDQKYTQDENEPLGWRTRNMVRVRITTIIHNMEDRYRFGFELSRLLWAHGWRGNTIFRDGRREAWIFHWKTEWVGGPEMPDNWAPETDLVPVEPPIIDAEFVDAPLPAEPEIPTEDSYPTCCTITSQNINDTRCLSMAKERLKFAFGKVELLAAAAKNPEWIEDQSKIIEALEVYKQAFQEFTKNTAWVVDFIEKSLTTQSPEPAEEPTS